MQAQNDIGNVQRRAREQSIPSDLSRGDPSFQYCREPDTVIQLPELISTQRWTSMKEMPPESITIVTQLSLERVKMLQAQCKTWEDRIAAVVYVPFISGFGAISSEVKEINGTSVDDIISVLDEFHSRMESEAKCALDLELLFETFDSAEDPNLGLYPFNALRNRALMMTRTEAVFLLDVDFIPSSSLPKTYQDKPKEFEKLMKQLRDHRKAFVIPAFQTYQNKTEGRKVAASIANGDKYTAVEAFKIGDISGFQLTSYSKGHSATNYTRWLRAEAPYYIKYEQGYEPYIILCRQYIPFYDERFRGYSRDKIVHINHLAVQLRIPLYVHPSAFVVHSPHPKASTFKTTKASGQWDLLYKLYNEVKKQIKAGVFAPVTSFAHSCPRTLKVDEMLSKL